MLTFAITNRRLESVPDESVADSHRRLAERAAALAAEGVDYLLIREKDLEAGELVELGTAVVAATRKVNAGMKILLAGRVDVALAVRADGVHLGGAAGELSAAQVRAIMPGAFVSVSCHRLDEVERARAGTASAILFAPVFGKTIAGQEVVPAAGLEMLRQACAVARDVPVFALGGITNANAAECLAAGAAGVAAIRMFFARRPQIKDISNQRDFILDR